MRNRILFTIALGCIGWGAVYEFSSAIANHGAVPLILLAAACLVVAWFVVGNNPRIFGGSK